MVAIDDADADERRPRGGVGLLRRGAAHSTTAAASTGRSTRRSTGNRCRCRPARTLWFHSRTPHRSGPNRSSRPRRALYPTYNAAREGDRRAEYYAAKAGRVRGRADARRPRAGVAHRRLRGTAGMKVVFTVLDALPARHVGERAHPGADGAGAGGGRCARPGPRGHDLGHVSEPRDLRDRRAAARSRDRHQLGAAHRSASRRRGSSDPRCRRCSTRAVPRGGPARRWSATSASSA